MISVSLSGPTLDRLADLAEQYGVEPDVMLARLLDRDPHDHDHRCPTCARLSEQHQQQTARVAADHQHLFSLPGPGRLTGPPCICGSGVPCGGPEFGCAML